MLCGAGMEPPRGRGKPNGARESQLFFSDVITKMFSKIHLDITTTSTEEHNIKDISSIPVSYFYRLKFNRFSVFSCFIHTAICPHPTLTLHGSAATVAY